MSIPAYDLDEAVANAHSLYDRLMGRRTRISAQAAPGQAIPKEMEPEEPKPDTSMPTAPSPRDVARAQAVNRMLRCDYENEPGHLSELVVDIIKFSWLGSGGQVRAFTPELAREVRSWADSAAERMKDGRGQYHLDPASFQALVCEGLCRFPECCCLDLVLRAVLEHLMHQQKKSSGAVE